MCGIGGCIGEEASGSLVKKMSALIRHRGPDDYGELVEKNVSLFSNRLSIIDVEGGHQPIFNEDETLAIFFNGEIYNFEGIKPDLELKGHKFKTRTDTEVILHGFEEYGPGIFSKLDGMFAIAIWDRENKRLILARDRVGIKPLYYSKTRDGWIFCSEIKGILADQSVEPAVSEQGLYYVVSLYYIPFQYTLFSGVFKLPPGCYLDTAAGDITRFWTVPSLKSGYCPEVSEVRSAVEQSVKRQLVSDVEVGSFLSGGLDTSSIVAFASKYYRDRLKTFCMGFGHDDDELDDAKRVAEHFGTEHYGFTITDRATLELYPQMIWHSEQPKLNTYSWFVNKFARKYVKVCLSGLGGDEIFFGYPTSNRFHAFLTAQKLMKVPGMSLASNFARGKRKRLMLNLRDRTGTYLATISPTYGSENERVFATDVKNYRLEIKSELSKRFFSENKQDFVQQAVFAEFSTKLPDDFLSIDDSMSMAHSLENRVPLLDNQLVELVLPASYEYNYENGTGKILLRRAMKGILPEECFAKKKQGFSLDVVKWWPGELGEEIRKTIPDSKAVKKYFNVDYLNRLITAANISYSTVSLLWTVYAFHVWHDIFIDRRQETASMYEPQPQFAG
jgi:asparagine synthase (glutamine-hydrolysing)